MNCDCERVADPSLLQTIFTRNDPALLSYLEANGKDHIAWITELRRSRSGKSTGKKPLDVGPIIEEVFLRTVSRLPTGDEIAKAQQDIAAAGDPVDGVRDLMWAMLNTREFMVNH